METMQRSSVVRFPLSHGAETPAPLLGRREASIPTDSMMAEPVTGFVCSHSRCGNHQLESRVRENRMHGSEGGEVTLPDPYS